MIWKGDTPKGNEVQMDCRDGTSDENICRLISTRDEYGLGAYSFKGVALDIGAHIGAVTVPLLIDNPDLTVIAVEPVFENLLMLRRNIELNDLGKRVTVLPVAAGTDGTLPIRHGWGGRHQHVGNLDDGTSPALVDEVPSMSLSTIYEVGVGNHIALLKIDCEGCEWDVLADPDIGVVEMIVGEFHAKRQGIGADRITDMLGDTHRVVFSDWVFSAVLK